MYDYDVVTVQAKMLGGRSYSETGLQAQLDEHAREGWRLAWIVPERDRLLVAFEREVQS